MADPRQPITPLRFDTPIVDPAKGTPTSQFVRIWQQLFGNETGTNEGLAAVEATANAAQLTADTAQADVDAAELDIDALQLAAVPVGGALGEVLTKDGAADYDMSWQPGGGGGGGVWALVSTTVIAAPVAQVDVIGLAGATDIMVIVTGLTASAANFRAIRVSTDNGASFFSGASDYAGIGASTNNLASYLALNNGSTTAALSGGIQILGANVLNVPKFMFPQFAQFQGLFTADNANAVNAVRVFNATGNLTGGTIYVLKR